MYLGVGIVAIAGILGMSDPRVQHKIEEGKQYLKTTRDDDGTDYQIITSWVNPEDKKLYLFSSESISSDVANMLEEEKITIKEFLVTYEQNNIRNYEMDITKLDEVKYEKNW